jgi:hypothetical protein
MARSRRRGRAVGPERGAGSTGQAEVTLPIAIRGHPSVAIIGQVGWVVGSESGAIRAKAFTII